MVMIDRANMFFASKALEFVSNFVKSYKGEINDNDFFSIFEAHIDQDDMLKLIRKNISSEALEKGKTMRSFRIDLESDPVKELLNCLWNNKSLMNEGRPFIYKLAQFLRQSYKPEKVQSDPAFQRFNELCALFKLNELESNALQLSILHAEGMLERHFMRGSRSGKNPTSSRFWEMLSLYLGVSIQKVRFIYSESQKLFRLGCIDNDCDVAFNIMIYMQGLSTEPLSQQYFSKVTESPLPWDFYGSLATEHGNILKELIRNRDPRKSFHVLLYGMPGTGKTSFAQSLASELGMTCYSIAQRDRSSKHEAATTPEFRLAALRVCNEQIGHEKSSLIMIDEADRVLEGGSNSFFSMLFGGGDDGDNNDSAHEGKGLLNTVMDSMTTPCIWITNSAAERLPSSSRRRFDYSIKFDKLNLAQRQMIFKNNIEAFHLGHLFTDEQITTIANKYEVSAGGITKALSNLRALSPDVQKSEKTISKLLDSHCKLLRIPTGEKQAPAKDYTLEGLNIKGSLELPQIIEAVRNFTTCTEEAPDAPRMNLLLSGAPGTGKTEFVKYLASVLGKKVVTRMGSDLLGKYVGQTEQRIRDSFEAAESERSILFFDEIDGLLRSRASASQGWEVTQVNEVLHHMENFHGIFIGSTNFNDNLDAASIRRFTFKLQFDYLNNTGKQHFFEKMFKSSLTETEKRYLETIPNLAPGDFRTVRQSLFYLGQAHQANMKRLKALEQEVANKQPHATSLKKIGF
jgi:transitional endoplasmic reticulum ATPase